MTALFLALMAAGQVQAATYSLIVGKAGTGAGIVSSTPGGISCGAKCFDTFVEDVNNPTMVILSASPAAGSVFSGWQYYVGGTATAHECNAKTSVCAVVMDKSSTFIATFTYDAASVGLTVSKDPAGTGSGTITSDPGSMYCGPSCYGSFANPTTVTLTATPASGSLITSWTGCTSSAGATCVVTMDAAKSVTAKFDTDPNAAKNLNIIKTGSGSGIVSSDPAGVYCGASCNETFPLNTPVTLTAAPASGSTFSGWSGGGCSGAALTCVVTMDAAKTVTATFVTTTIAKKTLYVYKLGGGSGAVTSDPDGINCPVAGCTSANFSFDSGTTVTLTATAATDSTFDGWTGAAGCSTATTCVVTMDAAHTVTAKFSGISVSQFLITVARLGKGSGVVTSVPAGIDCGGSGTCDGSFTVGAPIVLKAVPAAGNSFTGWSGCTNNPSTSMDCVLTVTAEDIRKYGSSFAITATFTQAAADVRTMTVTKQGMGTGSISSTSVPANAKQVDCGGTCSVDFTTGATVTLSVTAGAGSSFAGWRGACSGLATTCVVTMETGKSVIATFDLNAISVDKAGDGAGIVTSQPGGISCGTSCSAYFRDQPSVVLSATPSSGSVFAGWGGPCSGTSAACTVGTSVPQKANATFSKVGTPPGTGSYFAIFLSGTGSGAVSGSTGGINCVRAGGTESGTCSASLLNGTSLTLTAQPSAGSTFAGWSGACSATSPTCTLTMSAAQSVTASFNISSTSQIIAFGAAPSIAVGGTGPISATASSGLAVTFSSLTPSVCSVSGSTVSGLVAGDCTIAANQAGNGSISAAPQVTQTFAVSASFAAAIEYYHAGFGHYFVTSNADEAAGIDNGSIKGWARTGQAYSVYSLSGAGLSPVCRFFSTGFAPKSSHFYTPSATECDAVKSNRNWQFEAIAFYVKEPVAGVCASGLTPLYRVYNNGLSGAPNHRYTTCADILANMISRGWISEGAAMCLPVGSANCATDHSAGGVNYKATP
ncbi:MAG: hypothetical protein HY777_14285 [Betaproteobacteria bacterium]|nr:hypothetical protein [Betaproteobacteria bacterium]